MAAFLLSRLLQLTFSLLTKEKDQKSLLARMLLRPTPPSSSPSRLSVPLLNASLLPRPGPNPCQDPRVSLLIPEGPVTQLEQPPSQGDDPPQRL
ncbi:hypothetical protein NL676_029048 [Syzygium grande]|nr:hypothetical protein NL676_029048 [Syzygium grande]